MIAISEVRSAVLDDKPWTRLDELVRREIEAGRRVKDIFAELNGMTDDVDETPGITEDGGDAFLDTLDALVGNCHSSSCYTDPVFTSLPSHVELHRLPKLARIAFAARCARRVRPLVPHHWEAEPAHYFAAALRGVEIAERIAVGSEWRDQDNETLGMIDAARKTAFHTIPMNGSTKNDVVTHSLNSSASAAFAAADHPLSVEEAMKSANLAIAATVMLSGDCMPIDLQKGTEAIRRDFERLSDLSESYSWSDTTPVAPDVFGPMWPNGMPKGWPKEVPDRDFDFSASREAETLVGTS
jgi:hypothetical protein